MKRIRDGLFVIIFTASVLYSTNAFTAEKIDDFDNLAGEYAECAAYFDLAYWALKQSKGSDEIAKQYDDSASNAALTSLVLAKKSRSYSAAIEVTQARISMYKEKMKLEAHNSNANFSILMSKYHMKCIDLIDHLPENIYE